MIHQLHYITGQLGFISDCLVTIQIAIWILVGIAISRHWFGPKR